MTRSLVASVLLVACWTGEVRAQECGVVCPEGYACAGAACAPICFGGCPEGRECSAPGRCTVPAGAAAAPTAVAAPGAVTVVIAPGAGVPASEAAAASLSGLRGAEPEEPNAADGAYPLRYVDRPLTHRQGTLVPFLGLGMGVRTDTGDAGLGMTVALEYGLLNFLQVEVVPLNLRLAPDAEYQNPGVALGFRFFPHEIVEMGFRTAISVPVDGGSTGQAFQLPIRFHLGHVARIDTGASFSLYYDDSVDEAVLSVPFALAFNLGPYFFVSVETTFDTWTSTLDNASMSYVLRLGGTIPDRDRRPLADLALALSPFRLDFGSASGDPETGGNGPSLDTSAVTLSFSATFYFHLMR